MSGDVSLEYAIESMADLLALPPSLLRAITQVESNGDVYAWRAEPPYRYLWDIRRNAPFRKLTTDERDSETAPEDFAHYGFSSRDTEWWGQQASWGPMQVMGAVARELGFDLPFPALCDAGIGVAVGARFVSRLRDRFFGSDGWDGVAAAYNAGSPRRTPGGFWVNQAYVDKVGAAGGF